MVVFACATTKASDVHRMGREGDLDALVDAWRRAESDEVRIAVIEELAQHPSDRRGREIVLRQAESESEEPLKVAAVRAAAVYDGSGATKVLIARLKDAFPSVRETAEAALAARAVSAKAELLADLASNPSPLVRAACARLVAAAAKRAALKDDAIENALLERATHDDAPRVREAAVSGLGALDVKKARAQLVELMRTDEDESVRISAERAIQKLGDAQMSSVVVAVLPLKNDTGQKDSEIERFGAQLAEYVAARLSQGKVCQVVDRDKLEEAIKEMKKVGALLYDGDSPNAPEIGKLRIANQLVYGSLQKQGLVYTIVLDRMDVSTSTHIPGAAVTVRGYRADLEALKVRAADQLVASFR
jgi:TolB-like protein